MRRPISMLAMLGVVVLVTTSCGGTKDTGFPLETPSPTETHAEDTSSPEEPAEYHEGTPIEATQDNVFSPRYVGVDAGTTVEWVQVGASPHNVVLDDGSYDSHPDCQASVTDCMGDGGTAAFTFDEAGEFAYYCVIHGRPGDPTGPGNMAGIVFVS